LTRKTTAIKGKVVDWLDPKPLPYRDTNQRTIDFKGYLNQYEERYPAE
jgi:hypothetical protein